MKNYCKVLLSLLILTTLSACSFFTKTEEKRQELLFYIAPTQLENTFYYMKTPGFWIERHPYPDSLFLNFEEINHLNKNTMENLGLLNNLFDSDSVRTDRQVITSILTLKNYLRNRKLYTKEGELATDYFYQKIENIYGFTTLDSVVTPLYGFITKLTNQRLIPTDSILTVRKFNIEFDQVQNSVLDIGTPVNIWHRSSDGDWYYIDSPLSSGWVKTEHIAISDIIDWNKYLDKANYFGLKEENSIVVATNSKTEIYLDKKLTKFYGFVRMGNVFPYYNTLDRGVIEIVFPYRNKDGRLELRNGFVKETEVRKNYLPYTARNIIEQSFKMLNEPYGWGGMFAEQDCSRFIQMVFATVGIQMPRNGRAQGQIGQKFFFEKELLDMDDQEKNEALINYAVGGLTTLNFPGHIMLYLGSYNNKPYAIHTIWGYREPGRKEDLVRVISKTVVTDLCLGNNSERGSLIRRLNNIRIVK